MEDTELEKLDGFVRYYVTAQILGLLSVVGVFYWCFAYGGGFALSGSALFNWHPLFMTIGMLYLLGNSILSFRAFRNLHKNTLKYLHSSTNVLALVFIVLGALAVYINHVQSGLANFYSLHSWVGLVAVVLFLLQAIIGFSAFLVPGYSAPVRALLLPYHVYIGHAVFIIGTVAAVSGINEKAIFKLDTTYGEKGTEAIILNLIGLLFIAFAAAVVYITTNKFYKRYSRPEDSELLSRS